MKYLATEIEIEGVDWSNSDAILKEEAKVALSLFERGLIREMYFDEDHCAVLILECQSKTEAEETLQQLPLVKAGMIKFEIKELKPYTGFSRLL
ncbi:MAG TPA: hypothetical protein PLQ09_03065 [Prolixibacteraceae bacterium]|nr:superoxide dismutase [Bacteroidales bacterium]HQN93072.1 hypothetical protein [Prolixibacteraceae bacterium]